MQKWLRVRRSAAIIWIFIFCLTQLSGCSFIGSHFSRRDGAPNADIDVSKVPDAKPKHEAVCRSSLKDYVVNGHRYHVLKSAKGYSKSGYASWYGTKFHGNDTSMNEKYNVYAMTAASKELPLPTYVQVTNKLNGRQVIVRVNDRGPFHSDRILDLSYVAAKKLGFTGQGVAPVKVVAIDPDTWGKPKVVYAKTKSTSKNAIYLQVGAYAKLDNARLVSEKITNLTSKPMHIARRSNLYRVQIGPLASTEQSSKLKNLLEGKGFSHVLVVTG